MDSHISSRGVFFIQLNRLISEWITRAITRAGRRRETNHNCHNRYKYCHMHIQHAPVSTPNALRQVGKLFRELSHVYFPFIWAKTHRRDLRDSRKERWQDSADVLAPIFSRPNREIADRRMMFPCIHGSISFSKCFWESSRRLASDAIGA